MAEDQLTNKQRRKLKSERKHDEALRVARQQKMKTYRTIAGFGLLIVGVMFGVFLLGDAAKLPPTSQFGHIEERPSAHVLTEPIPENIQRHLLEHVEAGVPEEEGPVEAGPAREGGPGVIIQYNCDDYVCADDLIENLIRITEENYPIVYLAPNDYDGKIILTSEGKRLVIDAVDEEAIAAFINEA